MTTVTYYSLENYTFNRSVIVKNKIFLLYVQYVKKMLSLNAKSRSSSICQLTQLSFM
jgi:hypothetical protein